MSNLLINKRASVELTATMIIQSLLLAICILFMVYLLVRLYANIFG